MARLCSTEHAEARLKRASRVRVWMWTGCLARSEVQGGSKKGWQSQKTQSPEMGCLRVCFVPGTTGKVSFLMTSLFIIRLLSCCQGEYDFSKEHVPNVLNWLETNGLCLHF